MAHPSTLKGLTASQQEVFNALRAMADGATTITASTRELEAATGLTPKQVQTGLTGLLNASVITKAWNPDKYVWAYTITGGTK